MPIKHSAALMSVLAIWGCSGGGGENTSLPPVNLNPVFSSASTASVLENTPDAFYTATATDADGDTVTFAVNGGVDAQHFSLDTLSGQLSFTMAPDFEAPLDSDGDNQYSVVLTASDGRGGSSQLSLTVTVTDAQDTLERYRDILFTELTVDRNLQFATAPDDQGNPTRLFMDVIQPANDTATDRPVVLLFAGGGFVIQRRTSVESLAEAFAQRGYVTATVDYRTLDAVPVTADELAIAGLRATHDLFAAVRYVRAEANGQNRYGTRGDMIFVGGLSAGGVMTATAATLDPSDPTYSPATQAFLEANGGVYGEIGEHDLESSQIQGAFAVAGAVLDLNSVDENSAPIYAAHHEFDSVVPCDTAMEGSAFTGLVVSGSCDFIPALNEAGVAGELYLSEGTSGHINFTEEQQTEYYAGAAALFYTHVLLPADE